jgi:hypothetical protein
LSSPSSFILPLLLTPDRPPFTLTTRFGSFTRAQGAFFLYFVA